MIPKPEWSEFRCDSLPGVKWSNFFYKLWLWRFLLHFCNFSITFFNNFKQEGLFFRTHRWGIQGGCREGAMHCSLPSSAMSLRWRFCCWLVLLLQFTLFEKMPCSSTALFRHVRLLQALPGSSTALFRHVRLLQALPFAGIAFCRHVKIKSIRKLCLSDFSQDKKHKTPGYSSHSPDLYHPNSAPLWP